VGWNCLAAVGRSSPGFTGVGVGGGSSSDPDATAGRSVRSWPTGGPNGSSGSGVVLPIAAMTRRPNAIIRSRSAAVASSGSGNPACRANAASSGDADGSSAASSVPLTGRPVRIRVISNRMMVSAAANWVLGSARSSAITRRRVARASVTASIQSSLRTTADGMTASPGRAGQGMKLKLCTLLFREVKSAVTPLGAVCFAAVAPPVFTPGRNPGAMFLTRAGGVATLGAKLPAVAGWWREPC
jgi:hypothetical protein